MPGRSRAKPRRAWATSRTPSESPSPRPDPLTSREAETSTSRPPPLRALRLLDNGVRLEHRLGSSGGNRHRFFDGDLRVLGLDLGHHLLEFDALDLVHGARINDVAQQQVDDRDEGDAEDGPPQAGDLRADKEGDDDEDGVEANALPEQPWLDGVDQDRLGDDQDHDDEEGQVRSEGKRDEDDRDERERRPKERDEHEHARTGGQQEQVGEAEDQAEDESEPDLDQDQHDLRAQEASKRPTDRALDEQQGVGMAIRHDAADRAGDRLWICLLYT